MTVFEQLKALETLLNELWLERDDEVLRARLREGKLPPGLEGRNIPLEELVAIALYGIEVYAHQLRERLHGPMGVQRGIGVVGSVAHIPILDPETGEQVGEVTEGRIVWSRIPRFPPS